MIYDQAKIAVGSRSPVMEADHAALNSNRFTAPADIGTLDGLTDELDRLRCNAVGLRQRLTLIADSIFGAQPQPCTTEAAVPLANGKVSRLAEQLGWFSHTLGEMADEIARLERL